MFFIIPIVDVIPYWIDIRVITSLVQGREDALPRTPCRLDVDAVLFWERWSTPQKAALDVEELPQTPSPGPAQTALRRP